MYQSIMLAVDGSDNSLRAAKEAAKIAKLNTESHVEILYVSIPAKTARELLQEDPNRSPDEILKAANIGPIEEIFRSADINYSMTVLSGEAANTLVNYSKRHPCDLFVIGSRGLGAVRQIVQGSVSTKVMQRVECPVLMVK